MGYDMYAVTSGHINPLMSLRIPLGFKSAFTPGWVGLLMDRSSMGNKGMTKFAGVIDWSYRGEWSVILYNTTHTLFEFKPGDKIIQCGFFEYGKARVEFGKDVWLPPSTRGEGGFGSTDLKTALAARGIPISGFGELSGNEQTVLQKWWTDGCPVPTPVPVDVIVGSLTLFDQKRMIDAAGFPRIAARFQQWEEWEQKEILDWIAKLQEGIPGTKPPQCVSSNFVV